MYPPTESQLASAATKAIDLPFQVDAVPVALGCSGPSVLAQTRQGSGSNRGIFVRAFMRLIGALVFSEVICFASACSNTGSAGGSSGHGGSIGGQGGTGGTSAASGTAGTIGAGGTTGQAGTTGTTGSAGAGGASAGEAGHFYAAPNGTGTSCTAAAPCSITQAQTTVRTALATASTDIVVELTDGVYRLTAPLVFTEADSAPVGHKITWQAAANAHPILSGGKQITGWTMSDAGKNIWKASAPGTFATRQLYVDGQVAQRARVRVGKNGMSHASDTFPLDSAVTALNTAKAQNRIELHVYCNWSDHYAPVKSISNGTVTMVHQPWFNNTYGWDHITAPFAGPTKAGLAAYMENAYELLSAPGQWYQELDTGVLYYIPLSGQDMTKVDVELPQLEAILVVAGSSYDKKAHDLAFSGLTFSHTSWLNPNTDGYADQQSNAYVHGDGKDLPTLTGCPGCVQFPNGYPANNFEATRPRWYQLPAAVQVSVASKVSFVRDRFVSLGSAGLGIGEDDNAHVLGKHGLGADTIDVTGCVFNQLAASGIVAGGIQPPAHHPCGDAVCGPTDSGTPMIDRNITITDNLIHDVGKTFADSAGIWLTFVDGATISHNEIYNIPWSGIALSWGWGADDQGGSQEYANRGIYNYMTKYTTPTISKNNMITANRLHDMMLLLGDGGATYQNGYLPGAVYSENYVKGNKGQSDYYGWAGDSGSHDETITKNVYEDWNDWNSISNTDYPCPSGNSPPRACTGQITVTSCWYNSGKGIAVGYENSTVNGNMMVNGTMWPAEAMGIINAAGLETSYADLKTNP